MANEIPNTQISVYMLITLNCLESQLALEKCVLLLHFCFKFVKSCENVSNCKTQQNKNYHVRKIYIQLCKLSVNSLSHIHFRYVSFELLAARNATQTPLTQQMMEYRDDVWGFNDIFTHSTNNENEVSVHSRGLRFLSFLHQTCHAFAVWSTSWDVLKWVNNTRCGLLLCIKRVAFQLRNERKCHYFCLRLTRSQRSTQIYTTEWRFQTGKQEDREPKYQPQREVPVRLLKTPLKAVSRDGAKCKMTSCQVIPHFERMLQMS